MCHGDFDIIDHKFLIYGHSFSSWHRDFAIIEKRAKCCKLITLEDVKNASATARIQQPFKILDMGEKPFMDFDRAASMFIDTSKLGISKASWLHITKDHPGIFLYKQNYSDTRVMIFYCFKFLSQ